MGPSLKSFIKYLESRENKIIPWVIYSVGLALVIDTVLELTYSVLDYKAYQFMFQWLPPQMIFLRYGISVIWRCAFILALAGVCLRMDIFRKLLIALTWLEVATLFWKHPYQSIINADIYAHSHLFYFSQTFHLPWSSQQYYPYIIIVMLQLCILDLCKAVLILLIFSSPEVRKFFK
jgi:hypothetical protein